MGSTWVLTHRPPTLDVTGERGVAEDGEEDLDERGYGDGGVREALPAFLAGVFQRAVDQEGAVVAHERCRPNAIETLLRTASPTTPDETSKRYRTRIWRSTGSAAAAPESTRRPTEVCSPKDRVNFGYLAKVWAITT